MDFIILFDKTNGFFSNFALCFLKNLLNKKLIV